MKVIEGKVLRVDLDERKWVVDDFYGYKEWIGGQGVNQSILFNELPVGISAYDPENLIVVGAGILNGTSAPGACRTNIDSLNPFTGGIGSSNAGGYFGAELRRAGINHIVIKGRAENLVYLRISDGHVDFIDATHLRKKTISQTAALLHRELGDGFRSMIIGPAGENQVRSACIIVDESRAAGRCGLGAVMGSKNLKAIAVKGTGRVDPSHPKRFEGIVKECIEKINRSPFAKKVRRYGVYRQDPWEIESPYRNFSGEIPPIDKKQNVLPDAFLRYMTESRTCGTCPMYCWKVYHLMDGVTPLKIEALQINSIHNFAARLDLFDPKTILKAHALCNDLGLDEDNVSGVLAWVFECFAKGLISEKETDGIVLHWGDEEPIFELLEKIAYRVGFGDLLAEGGYQASLSFPGTQDSFIHIKGQELFEVLWACPAWALGTVVSARGGTHTRGAVKSERLSDIPESLCQRLFGIPCVGDKASYENKERLVLFFEKLQVLSNSLGMCYFVHGLTAADMLLPEDYARLLSAATGESIDTDHLMWMGERIFNLEKCFNILHTKWSREDEMPPKRFSSTPLDGKFKIDEQAWGQMLDRYYDLHGWDRKTGKPFVETLERLNLHTAKEKLRQHLKLP